MAQKFPYLKHDFKTKLVAGKAWKLFECEQGCTRIDQEGVCLRMDRPPPAPAAAAPSSPQGPVLVEASKQISNWFKSNPAAPVTPTPPPEPKGPLLVEAWKEIQARSTLKAEAKGILAPFDIQDIPPAMDKILGWPKSADLMRQFFAGDLNYSPTQKDEINAINQRGKYYAREFVETKRFTWKWLLGNAAVEKAYVLLTSPDRPRLASNMYSGVAKRQIEKKILPSANTKYMGQIDTLEECGGDVFELHRRFQFQNSPVSMFTVSDNFAHTDLGGSLGNFALYAAIAHAKVRREDFKQHTVTVTHVYVYAKDNYSFNDTPGEPSQYLGHWNKTGVIYAYLPSVVQLVRGALSGTKAGKYLPEINSPELRTDASNPWFDGVDFVVQIGGHYTPENIFYPVRNINFLNWQIKSQRGGNVLSFSDLKLIQLPSPIDFPIGGFR